MSTYEGGNQGGSGDGVEDDDVEGDGYEGDNQGGGDDSGQSIQAIVSGMVVGGLLTLLTELASGGITLIDTYRDGLLTSGATLGSQAGTIWRKLVGVVVMPIELFGDASSGLGLLAPVATIGVFALVAGLSAGIAMVLYRIIRLVT